MEYEDFFDNDDLYDCNEVFYNINAINFNDTLQEELNHEQTLISKKDTKNIFSVERNYINSYAYHEKFENLAVSKALQESLYIQCGRLLEYVDSLPEENMGEERMLAINFRTGEFLVDNFEREGSINSTRFNEKEMQKINECKDSLALIHNHSKSDRPSAQDLLSYLHSSQVKISVIACHNGDIYAIYKVSPSFEIKYNELLQREKEKTSEIELAKRRATTQIYELNNNLSQRHKYFIVEKL